MRGGRSPKQHLFNADEVGVVLLLADLRCLRGKCTSDKKRDHCNHRSHLSRFSNAKTTDACKA